MIPVTKPFLPPKSEVYELFDSIWSKNWLTNNGPLVNRLELELKQSLGLDHLLLTTNGTISLQIAMRALNLKGEIITTPFSYIATSSSIFWENLKPVFADINPDTFNIDPDEIRKKITKETSAICATHVFGNPCDIEEIESIADEFGLKVIYDAAHCFGVEYDGASVLSKGNVSSISFHATKLFHSVEGGALITKDPKLIERMAYMRNFGHDGPEKFNGVGINAKNSEFHAAMGIVNLKYVDAIIKKRKLISQEYLSNLKNADLKFQKWNDKADNNHAYFPVLFKNEMQLLKSIEDLTNNNIYPRRYFYPSLNQIDYLKSEKMPNSEDVASRVLCLPLYFDLSLEEVDMVSKIILNSIK